MRVIRGWKGTALAGLLIGGLLAGCDEDSTGPGDGPGSIAGTVRPPTGGTIVNGRVEVYVTLEELQSGTDRYQAALQSGASGFTYRIDGVEPGLYLMSVCGAAGALESCVAVSTLLLIYLSPTVQVDLMGNPGAWFPLRNPALLTIPLSFAVGMLVSLATREDRALAGFDGLQRQMHLGAAGE